MYLIVKNKYSFLFFKHTPGLKIISSYFGIIKHIFNNCLTIRLNYYEIESMTYYYDIY